MTPWGRGIGAYDLKGPEAEMLGKPSRTETVIEPETEEFVDETFLGVVFDH